MMIVSRFWYAILAVLAGFAVYATMMAVGQYNRRSIVATNETLADDSNVVRWALQIDSRHRLDALMVGSLDKGIQDSLVATSDKDKIPQKAKDDAKKSLSNMIDKIPAQYRPDAIFVVDRDGRMVAEVGYAAAEKFEDFELGGYSAVNDALHGWLRDDTWVWGGQVYRVAARPVEYDVTQPPVGAVVGLRAIDRKFVQDLAKDTHTNVVFYAQGIKLASGSGVDGFDESQLDLAIAELPKLDADPTYKDKGHTEIRDIASPALGGVFAKLDGDAFDLGAGYAVARTRVTIPGALSFLSGADDADKKNVSWPMIIGIIVAGLGFGLLLTFMEHDRPLKAMRVQAAKLKKGEVDLLQLPQLGGALRDIGADINAGIERVAEKGGGAPRKAADLESILGPVPAEPSMSAFSFPLAGGGEASQPGPRPPGPPSAPKLPGGTPSSPHLPPRTPSGPGIVPPGPMAPMVGGGNTPPPPLQRPETAPTTVQRIPGADGPLASPPRPAAASSPQSGPISAPIPSVPIPSAPMRHKEDEEEATMVAAVPQDVLARATGEHSAEEAEWPSVYEDFVKTKKQCHEPTEGLTFDKFRQTLRKNRDALVQRHNCKRVKFTVYVKDGRASLKATPIKD